MYLKYPKVCPHFMQRLYRNINLIYIASIFGTTMVYSSPQLLMPSCSCFFPCPAIHSPKHLFTRCFYLFFSGFLYSPHVLNFPSVYSWLCIPEISFALSCQQQFSCSSYPSSNFHVIHKFCPWYFHHSFIKLYGLIYIASSKIIQHFSTIQEIIYYIAIQNTFLCKDILLLLNSLHSF